MTRLPGSFAPVCWICLPESKRLTGSRSGCVLGREDGAAKLDDLVVGFRIDKAEMEKLVGESINIDLNRTLEHIFKAASLKKYRCASLPGPGGRE